MPLSEADRVYDELLVTLIQSGDRRAGERLVARWQPRLARTARRLLHDDEAARDAVQEAWASIFRGAAGLNDPARFPAWAFGILHRKCADRIRDAQRLRTEPALDLPEPNGEDRAAIDQAFDRLTPEHRAAALLHFGEGLTLAEVAAATNVAIGTAKSRIFHARRHLRAALSGDDT